MKMKVKRGQRQIALSLNTKSYSQLCFCIAYVVLTMLCLLESTKHVDAYINGVTNVTTNSFQHFNIHHVNNNRRKNESSHRMGRFLFDTLFGIDTPTFDAVDLDDDDDSDEPPKPCKCGKAKKKKNC